jgi:predicted transcriptional regulator of viral defense system
MDEQVRIVRIFICTPGRSRTRNLTGRNRLLYPVELQGLSHIVLNEIAFPVSTEAQCVIMESLGGRSSVG